MVGYAGAGYRLWDPKTNEIVISRDVKFDESKFRYNEENKMEEAYKYYEEESSYHNEDNEEKSDTNQEQELELSNYEDTETEQVQENLPKRQIKPPVKFNDYDLSNIAYALVSEDPTTYKDAIQQAGWPEAIEKELEAHKTLGTWEVATLPAGHKAIDTKWVFRTKQDDTKKARLVAKGFQEETPLNKML